MARKLFSFAAGMALAFAGVFFLVWVLWRLWARRSVERGLAPIEIEPRLPEPAGGAPPVQARAVAIELEIGVPQAAVVPDDLKRIEGIGPKLSSVLQGAGILTFAQLAAAGPERLAQILEAADPRLLRLADPTTWPEQAALAAAGKWEALEALQGTLKGGRRA